MGERIVDLMSSPHRAAEALLPWLLNGTLSTAERLELERHLHDCAACRAELDRQQRLAGIYREAAVPVGDPGAALARLSARLDAEAAPPPRRTAPGSGWRLVAALQLCIIAALAWTVWLLRAEPSPEATPAAYRGLAASEPASGDALVFFAGAANEVEIRSVLRRAGARIVDGPTSAGAYVLRFERGADTALAALRVDHAVARVEPLVAAGVTSPAPPR